MAQVLADRRDIDFVLYEQINAEELTTHEKYNEFNKKTFDLIITEARNLAVKEILPTFAEGDREGVHLEDGQVRVPACFHRPYKLLREGEWIAMPVDPALGGQGLPISVYNAASEYLVGANYAFTLYAYLAYSAGELIETFGTEAQKKLFLKKMYTGQWGGTMQLTEPQAGSDVGALTSSAVKNPDGTYSITGNKIFITAGDHDLVENIIHPVLARIEGAPSGTKGISLFIVPKIWVKADGSLGEPNDIVCTAVEEKMGIHGSATCAMALGSKGKCRGLLLGEENKGMQVMFHMMNEARLAVGFIGFVNASAAYMYALNYARERLQGKDLESFNDPDAPQVPIIRHADVRRMLLWMKAHVEGIRSLIYYVGSLFDRQICCDSEDEKDYYQGLIDLLTPVVKSYSTDRGFEVCVEAIQIYGGYGYTKDNPVEQLLRDTKISSIYEGTNGIQAMDLLGRKLGMKGGAVFMNFLGEIQKTVANAKTIPSLNDLASNVDQAVNRLGEVALHLGKTAMSPDVKIAFAYAKPFLDVVGDVCMAWMHLWRATIAVPKLEKIVGSLEPEARVKKAAKNKSAAFYEGQFQTAKYFINSILPITLGRMNAIAAGDGATVEMPETSFGS
ncbi:MAG: acyl-CoA dehydrogenase [Desulfobacterales bacterium]|nr:MAG: acyl-CoA dehydrogenase [Desulfobacterales bacterium]